MNEKFKDNNNLITYKEWQTEIVKKTKTLKGSGAKKDVNVDTKTYRSIKVVLTNKKNKFIKKLLDEIAILKEQNKRKISQFRRIKEVCRIVNGPSMKAVSLRMDWSEKAKLFQCRQEKSNYYIDIQVSVNTAVVYQCNDFVRGVRSLQYGHR